MEEVAYGAGALIGVREGVCSVGTGLQLDFMALERWLFCTCNGFEKMVRKSGDQWYISFS